VTEDNLKYDLVDNVREFLVLRFSLNTIAKIHSTPRYEYRQSHLSDEMHAKFNFDDRDAFRSMEVQIDDLYDFILLHIEDFQDDVGYVVALLENDNVSPHDVLAFLEKFETKN